MKCSICGRITPQCCLEQHHLTPRSIDKKSDKIEVCIDCGNQIHVLFTLKELKNNYNTLKKLLANDKIQQWIRWIRKKTEFGVCMKAKKKR
jgi:hypothetical protein